MKKRAYTLLNRLRVRHKCMASNEPTFEQISVSVQGHRTFKCLACQATVILKNKSAL